MAHPVQDASTAGIGDPYWYEWSVGQRWVIDMLSGDSGIASVTLQKTGSKGLDDVVVQFTSGDARFIQVKHTRVEDTLTFGDLVSAAREDEVPLLRQIAECWNEAAKATTGSCEAWLVTNRNAGKRAASTWNVAQPIVRPPLAKFLDVVNAYLASISKLDDISLPPEWLPAWREEWLPQLIGLETDARKLEFMRAFKIHTSEQGLEQLTDDLIARLGATFGAPPEVAKGLLARLDSALREWVTSIRGASAAITVERAYEALALRNERLIGEHGLPPPAPFFPTRTSVVEQLAERILNRGTPVIFLSGEPGSGKTAVVSALANRRDPILDLRYHAYRPVTPENQLLPADAGETTKARTLWSDLALSPVRASGELVSAVVPDASRAGAGWADVLRLLRPLVAEDDSGFRVFHNDVRVFLLRRVRADDRLYRDCASRIADHFVGLANPRPKHEVIQDLLGIARRYVDQVRLFTPGYVIESHAIGQRLDTLTAHALVAADALTKVEPNWDLVHELACGLLSLVQLRASLEWRNAESVREERPHELGTVPVRPAERVVVPRRDWSHAALTAALGDVERLLSAQEDERAIAAFRRWFDDLAPADVWASTGTKNLRVVDDESGPRGLATLLGRMLGIFESGTPDRSYRRLGLSKAGHMFSLTC